MKSFYPYLVLLGTLLFLGGLNYQKTLVEILGLALGFFLLLFLKIKHKKIKIPQFFLYYVIFLLVAALYSPIRFANRSTYDYLLLFTSGGLFYLLAYNLKDKIGKALGWLTVILGILFLTGFILSFFVNLGIPWGSGLVAPYTENHHHLGDFWVIPVLFLFERVRQKRKLRDIILLAVGIIVIVLSLSRSAYLALGLGVYLIFSEARLLILALSALAFILTSVFKTTLFSRIYFLQAIDGIVKNPLGVGLGNFAMISEKLSTLLNNERVFSSLTHNLFLEILVGLGIFGLPFIFWFYKVVRAMFKKKIGIYTIIFFALSLNFFFDTTYIIPTMLWLWFLVLGLSENQNA